MITEEIIKQSLYGIGLILAGFTGYRGNTVYRNKFVKKGSDGESKNNTNVDSATISIVKNEVEQCIKEKNLIRREECQRTHNTQTELIKAQFELFKKDQELIVYTQRVQGEILSNVNKSIDILSGKAQNIAVAVGKIEGAHNKP